MGVVNLELWLMIIKDFLIDKEIDGALEVLELLLQEVRGEV